MQSLGASRTDRDWEAGASAEAVRRRASYAVILPRFLRRPARYLARLDWKLPRAAGLKALVALFVATGVAGVFAGGHGGTVASAVTAWVGFGIDKVVITGQSETSEVAVLDALDIGTYPSVLTLDIDAARARIEELPWVKRASVKKLFPDTVEIVVTERTPYAIWQHEGELALIDATGRVISHSVDERYANLPRVVGEGAAEKAAGFYALVTNYPSIASRTKAGIYVSGSRWNVLLANGITLMLPAEDPAAALASIDALDRTKQLLAREIVAVDLRRESGMILRLTDKGLAAHTALRKDAERAKRVWRNI